MSVQGMNQLRREYANRWQELPEELRRELYKAALEALQQADSEGLGGPYEEEALELAEFIGGMVRAFDAGEVASYLSSREKAIAAGVRELSVHSQQEASS